MSRLLDMTHQLDVHASYTSGTYNDPGIQRLTLVTSAIDQTNELMTGASGTQKTSCF